MSMSRWLAVAALASCAPSMSELVRDKRWTDACAARARNPADFDHALVEAIAPGLRLDVQVLDRATLERELAVPVAGDLLDRIAIVRFAARSESSIMRALHIEPTAIDDGSISFARWPTPVRTLTTEEARLFVGLSQDTLSDRGWAAFFTSPQGMPAWPAPRSSSIFDNVPVPLTHGARVKTFRDRAAADDASAASIARGEELDRRATALHADAASASAITRMRERLQRREWFLLLPGGASNGRGLWLEMTGLVEGRCRVALFVAVDLDAGQALGRAVNARFPDGPRALADLRWRTR